MYCLLRRACVLPLLQQAGNIDVCRRCSAQAILPPLSSLPSDCGAYLLDGHSENAPDAKTLAEGAGLCVLSSRPDGSDCPKRDAFSMLTSFLPFYLVARGDFCG